MKDFPALCVDNFYSDPDWVREFALAQEYKPSPDGAWPGKRTEELSILDKDFFTEFCYKLFSLYFDLEHVQINWVVSTRFQLIDPQDHHKDSLKNRGWIHYDYEPFGGLIYLNPTIDTDCGTSLFQIKENPTLDDSAKDDFYLNGTDDDFDQSLRNHNGSFTETVRFQNIYNRLISFDGHTAHGANSLYTDIAPRLTQVFFVKNIECTGLGPLQRHKQFL
jgi:hypothetical protein